MEGKRERLQKRHTKMFGYGREIHDLNWGDIFMDVYMSTFMTIKLYFKYILYCISIITTINVMC